MSDDLYYTRLRFHNGVGLAKKHGTAVTVTLAPDLGSGPVHMVIYTPEIDQAEVTMRNADPPRRMTNFEIRAADELLDRLTREPMRDSRNYAEP